MFYQMRVERHEFFHICRRQCGIVCFLRSINLSLGRRNEFLFSNLSLVLLLSAFHSSYWDDIEIIWLRNSTQFVLLCSRQVSMVCFINFVPFSLSLIAPGLQLCSSSWISMLKILYDRARSWSCSFSSHSEHTLEVTITSNWSTEI